jgi:hypothetical protein
MSLSLKSFHVPKENMGYAKKRKKKREKRKYPGQKSMREKINAKEHE